MKTNNILDKAIAFISPSAARRRLQERARIEHIEDTLGERAYDGAKRGRNTEDWQSNSASANIEVQKDIVKLRDRSRELARNNPYMKNWLRVMPNNIIGTGIIPQPVMLTRSGNAAKVKEIWKLWAQDVKCDYDQRMGFYGLQHLILKTVVQSGECLIIRRRATSDYDIPLRLQVLEGDYINQGIFTYTNEWGGRTWYGVAFNKKGERVGYYLWNNHPGEFASTTTFVSAKDVIHVYQVDRPGQVRGVPDNHAAMIAIKDLNDYEYSERQRAKIASCLVGAIKQDPTEGNNDLASSFETIEPGTFHRLQKGEDIVFNRPPTSTGYPEYTKANLRSIAAGVGTTYEAMTGDLSNVNFSSGRMGWLEFQRTIQHWQDNVMIPACNTVWDWFIEAAQIAALIPINAKVRALWTPPRREMIDPVKETKAQTDAVRSGFLTWHEVIRAAGGNPEEVFDEMKREYEMFEKAGLKPITFPEFDGSNTSDTISPKEEDTNHGKQ